MKITFLGTIGWYDTDMGHTPSILIETKNEYIVLDAGFGLGQAEKYIKTNKPLYLFLSHPHIDHICGLHTLVLLKNKVSKVVLILSEKYYKEIKTFASPPYSDSFKQKHKNLKIIKVKPGTYKLPIEFECQKINHICYTLGFRIKLENKIISYCCDTGPCKNVIGLSKNADLLIHECALGIGESDMKWGHSGPEVAATAAKNAKTKKLILTHLSPNNFDTKAKAKKAEKVARKIFKNTQVAFDKMEIEI